MTCMKTLSTFTAIAVLAALLGACASGGPKKPPAGTPEPDKFLFDRGNENLAKKRWIVAREYYRQLVSGNPLPRQGEPDEIAYGVLYLASDESGFTTGTELVIDGGYTAH